LAAEGDSRLWIERHTSFAMMWLEIHGKMLLPVPKISASRTEAATFRKRQYQNKTTRVLRSIVAIPASTPPQHPSTRPARVRSREISLAKSQLPPHLLLDTIDATYRQFTARYHLLIYAMSKAKYKPATLSALVSDSEDDQIRERDAMPTPDSAAENKAPGKKGGRGRAKVAPAKVTKTKAPARRTSGRLNAKATAPAAKKGKRPALADRTNQQNAEETEEVDEFAQDDEVMQDAEIENTAIAVKQTKTKAPATKKKAPAGRPKVVKEVSRTDYNILDDTVEAPKPVAKLGRKKAAPKKKEVIPEPSPEKVIPETQVPFMDVDEDGDAEEEIEQTVTKTAPHARSRQESRPWQPSIQQRRAGSASDTERDRGDPVLRRKLGDMTKKYENMHIKYQDLKEIGLKESERNFERLKKQSDEKTKSKWVVTEL
jgi:hypothetical protein